MVAKDKIMHFFGCFGLIVMGTLYGINQGTNGVYVFGGSGIIAALIAGFGKELYDSVSVGGTGWSDLDIQADLLGVSMGAIVWVIALLW